MCYWLQLHTLCACCWLCLNFHNFRIVFRDNIVISMGEVWHGRSRFTLWVAGSICHVCSNTWILYFVGRKQLHFLWLEERLADDGLRPCLCRISCVLIGEEALPSWAAKCWCLWCAPVFVFPALMRAWSAFLVVQSVTYLFSVRGLFSVKHTQCWVGLPSDTAQ